LDGKFTYETYEAPARDSFGIPVRYYRPITRNTHAENQTTSTPQPPAATFDIATSVAKFTRPPAFVHIHGGGYLNGSLDTEISVCAAIAVALQMVVIHPLYRHTDSVKFPVPHHDVQDALDWIFAKAESPSDANSPFCFDPARVVIGGQSAGSGIAAAMVQVDAERGHARRRFCGQVLTIPWLFQSNVWPYDRFERAGVDKSKTSPFQCAHATGLSREKLCWYESLLSHHEEGSEECPLLNPGVKQGSQLRNIPRSAFIIAGADPLRDQGLLYAKSLIEEEVPTKVFIFPGVPHTFRSCVGLPSAELFMPKLLDCIAWAMDDSEVDGSKKSTWDVVQISRQ
ncbi:Alpha/Beta hydrolase protein, partial [Microdochium trichocladiopsis]